jgi:hypothetical protein
VDDFKLTNLPPEYSRDAGTAFDSQRRDTVAIPVFWIVLFLSALLHVAALYFLPPLHFALRPAGDPDSPIAVELRPRLQPPPGVPVRAVTAPAPEVAPALVANATPPAAPPVPPVNENAQRAPEAMSSSSPQPEPSAPERSKSPNPGDFASSIEARRRARGESAPAPERSSAAPQRVPDDDVARSNRIIAANLGLGRTPTFGGEPSHGGGVFHVTRLGYSDAEFLFYGWNKDIRRNTSQLIEVRKGEHSDIKLAVIRRMIAIVREHESGDFRWESLRLGRDVMLSARPADNTGLEDFMMREFFESPRP